MAVLVDKRFADRMDAAMTGGVRWSVPRATRPTVVDGQDRWSTHLCTLTVPALTAVAELLAWRTAPFAELALVHSGRCTTLQLTVDADGHVDWARVFVRSDGLRAAVQELVHRLGRSKHEPVLAAAAVLADDRTWPALVPAAAALEIAAHEGLDGGEEL